MTTIDIAALRQWIGRTVVAEDAVSPRLVAQFRAALDPHLAPTLEGEAPLLIHWCLAPEAAPMADLGPDGHPARGGFLPPVPLPRRMWAGGEIRMLAPLRIGDRVTRRSTVEDVVLKEGRSGPLCFVTVRHEIATGRGPVLHERQDIVYRGPADGAPPAPAGAADPADAADRVWTIDPSPVLLFRYSALTFNGHRIHYDQPYATGAEGYPGLVVHGPLQATLLFNLAALQGGRGPSRFTYRAVAPLFAGRAIRAALRGGTEGGAEGWTEDPAGRVGMRATAAW